MKKFFLVLVLLISLLVTGQTEVDKLEHNFGTVDETSMRYVDFYIKNNSNKREYMLSVKPPKNIHPREFNYLFNKKFLEPDSTMIIRFHVNPQKKGRFKYVVPVFMSDRNEPFRLVISGDYKPIGNTSASFQDCPNFNQSPNQGNPYDFKLTVG